MFDRQTVVDYYLEQAEKARKGSEMLTVTKAKEFGFTHFTKVDEGTLVLHGGDLEPMAMENGKGVQADLKRAGLKPSKKVPETYIDLETQAKINYYAELDNAAGEVLEENKTASRQAAAKTRLKRWIAENLTEEVQALVSGENVLDLTDDEKARLRHSSMCQRCGKHVQTKNFNLIKFDPEIGGFRRPTHAERKADPTLAGFTMYGGECARIVLAGEDEDFIFDEIDG